MGLDMVDRGDGRRRQHTEAEVLTELGQAHLQLGLIGGMELGHRDQRLAGGVVFKRREADLGDLGAESRQHVERGLERGNGGGGDLGVGLVEMPDDADAKTADRPVDRRRPIGDGIVDARRIVRVVAGDGAEKQGRIAHADGNWTGVIE